MNTWAAQTKTIKRTQLALALVAAFGCSGSPRVKFTPASQSAQAGDGSADEAGHVSNDAAPLQKDAASAHRPDASVTPTRPIRAPGILARAQIPAVFLVPGTQVGEVQRGHQWSSDFCKGCHSTGAVAPYDGWKGSLMANAGRDPLVFAQVATANQDLPGVGYYCLRCHTPNAIITGTAYDPTGGSLNAFDQDGVSCHFCHSLIDPLGAPGTSSQDLTDTDTLKALAARPTHYGDAMFVLAPGGQRRGPLDPTTITAPAHEVSYSPFFNSPSLCGTCHDFGNPALVQQADGTFALGALDHAAQDADPQHQFPVGRTYTEWRLSTFATSGVDLKGKFGGSDSIVQTCQDCHMPSTAGAACKLSAARPEIPQHDFAGAASWVLKVIGLQHKDDAAVDQAAMTRGQAAADSMLARAVTLEIKQNAATLAVRVVNDTGHKFPTGHCEGRRAWINVVFRSSNGKLVAQYGGYDSKTAELDAASTSVFEMQVGLSSAQAQRVGLAAGLTTHSALADTILKDTRIPPRGFNRAQYAVAGAPVVGADYVDGQYWAELELAVPTSATSAEVNVLYQSATPRYIEALARDNKTNDTGATLHDLWLRTDKAPPTVIAKQKLSLTH